VRAIVCLPGRPEAEPLLGLRPWSPSAPSAQLDLKLTVNLREGRPAAGERLALELALEGQELRLRWTTGAGAVGRLRVYDLKLERWEARADKPRKVHSLKRASLHPPPFTFSPFLPTFRLGRPFA